MKIFDTLNDTLLKQTFNDGQSQELLKEYMQAAYIYSKIENSIAVLSDLKSNKSYVYYGKIATQLGICEKDNLKEIGSIWEDELLEKIHPDDLFEKYMLELQFFHFVKKLPAHEKTNFYIISKIRMREKSGKYALILHRMFYVCSPGGGNPRLALCLYNYSQTKLAEDIYGGVIVNSITGNIIEPDRQNCNDILSEREKEVLLLIRKGKKSREISETLFISKHTVDRHRQNILEKLRVSNSIEACRIAALMGLF